MVLHIEFGVYTAGAGKKNKKYVPQLSQNYLFLPTFGSIKLS
jgi:hypothetical protein